MDFTIYSIDKDASDNDTSQSVSTGLWYSYEYQTLKATDDTPGAQVTPKPMVWKTPPVFTNAKLSENLTKPTPMRMYQSSSTPARDHESRMGDASMKKSPASTTPKSDVKREVLSTTRRSVRVQHQHSMTLTPTAATTEIDTTTPALAKLGATRHCCHLSKHSMLFLILVPYLLGPGGVALFLFLLFLLGFLSIELCTAPPELCT